jgi:uncharacterized protein (TIGR02391 family)
MPLQLPQLQCSKAEATSLIAEQIKRGRQINPDLLLRRTAQRRYRNWDRETHNVLLQLFDTDRYAKEFENITKGMTTKDGSTWQAKLFGHLTVKIELLKEFQRRIEKHLITPTERPADFWCLIHPDIINVTKTRFEAGHYADCAESAFKYINNVVKAIVKGKTGNELDGASLMRTAFSPKNPLITIDDLSTNDGQSIQQGYMDIFAGAMTGIRNPKAHGIVTIGPERAIHFIYLASLLLDTLDIAEKKYRYVT